MEGGFSGSFRVGVDSGELGFLRLIKEAEGGDFCDSFVEGKVEKGTWVGFIGVGRKREGRWKGLWWFSLGCRARRSI